MAMKSKRLNAETPASSNGHAPVRAVLYAQVSTEEQRERQTIQTQIDYAQRQCERDGIRLVEMYADVGVSGTIPLEKRPEGARLLADVAKGRFNAVWVYKVDRLGRNTLDGLIAISRLASAGIAFHSITESFDTSTPQGQLFLTQLISFAEFERSQIRERITAGVGRALRRGQVYGSPPYGYRRGADGMLEINEEEAQVVRLIFRLSADRRGTAAIAQRLNDMKILTPYTKAGRKVKQGQRKVGTSGLWRFNRVGNILHSPTYKGLRIYKSNGEEIHHRVPAIVSPDLWERAQEALRANWRSARRNAKHEFLLRSLVLCGFCEHLMIGITIRTTRYYRCSHTMRHVSDPPCPSQHIKADEIESAVWEELRSWILNPPDVEADIRAACREQEERRTEWSDTLYRLRTEIARAGEERQRLLTLYRKGAVSEEELERQLAEVAQERTRLEQAAAELEQRLALAISPDEAIIAVQTQLTAYQKVVKKAKVSPADKRRIVEEVVEIVQVKQHRDDKSTEQAGEIMSQTVLYQEGADTLSEGLGPGETGWSPDDKSVSSEAFAFKGPYYVKYRFPFKPARAATFLGSGEVERQCNARNTHRHWLGIP